MFKSYACQNRLVSKQHLKISRHVAVIQYHYRVWPKEMTTSVSFGCIIIIELIWIIIGKCNHIENVQNLQQFFRLFGNITMMKMNGFSTTLGCIELYIQCVIVPNNTRECHHFAWNCVFFASIADTKFVIENNFDIEIIG